MSTLDYDRILEAIQRAVIKSFHVDSDRWPGHGTTGRDCYVCSVAAAAAAAAAEAVVRESTEP